MQILVRYGTFIVLLLLCGVITIATINEQSFDGVDASEQLAKTIVSTYQEGDRAIVVARQSDTEFTEDLRQRLERAQIEVIHTVNGEPRDLKKALDQVAASGETLAFVACIESTSKWKILDGLSERYPSLGNPKVVAPENYLWSDFLTYGNIMSVLTQVSVIAIIAVGMTFVIITGGIDLSVGSLIALSAVVATILIRDLFGGKEASAAEMMLACVVAIAVCAAVGTFSGLNVIGIDIPAFIVTLAMMLVARGAAMILAEGQAVQPVPESFTWLGRDADLQLFGIGIPNCVVLMGVIYLIAHVVMTQTVLGRHIYAVGGNREAAFLSGVPVKRVLLFCYFATGLLSGVGGIIVASMLESGLPTFGMMKELEVIAAVVVGGTSLSGGRGTILGTLVGALIIGVIRNGMNLTGIDPYTQDIVLGFVILGAVALDKLKIRFLERV